MNLNINQIRTNHIINKTYSRQVPFRAGKIEDTFERTTPAKKPTDNKAIQWIEENDYVNKNLMKDITNPENKIGAGFSHTGFLIPGNNDFILRAENSNIPTKQFSNYEIKDTEDKKLKVNVGQPVAEIVLKGENDETISTVEVLKRQHGEPLGVKPFCTMCNVENGQYNPGELPYEDPTRKTAYAKSIQEVADLPIESFEKFLNDVNSAADSGYRFDYLNSNNILVDKGNNALNIIDTEYRGQYSKIDCGSILYALTNFEYFDSYVSNDNTTTPVNEKSNAIKNNIEIIDKFTTAMKNRGLKFDREKHSKEAQDLFLGFPMKIFCQENDYNKIWNKLEEKGLA